MRFVVNMTSDEEGPADDVEALAQRLVNRADSYDDLSAESDYYYGSIDEETDREAAALIRRQQAEVARVRERLARVEGPEDWPAAVARLRSSLERCEAALQKHEKNGS